MLTEEDIKAVKKAFINHRRNDYTTSKLLNLGPSVFFGDKVPLPTFSSDYSFKIEQMTTEKLNLISRHYLGER